jgi:hypothetical protein
VSDRAAQLFVSFLEMRIVRPIPGSAGRTVVVERDEVEIIQVSGADGRVVNGSGC